MTPSIGTRSNKKKTATASAKCRPRFRITLGDAIALGPGKIELLEAIDQTGSISAGARALGLSYKRAWDMVATMNACFTSVLVDREKGGSGGGGAHLTDLGQRVATLYRKMESKAEKATAKEWDAIQESMKKSV